MTTRKKNKAIQSILSRLENELKELLPGKGIFHESFLEMEYRNSEVRRQLIKYILNKINNFYKVTDEYRIDFDRVNIEHILPRKPHENWNLSPKEIKPYVNLLGNLTLLSKKLNSAAQNSTLDKKIKEFEQSELPITRELTEYLKKANLKWDKDRIFKRHEDLADLAYLKIWAVST